MKNKNILEVIKNIKEENIDTTQWKEYIVGELFEVSIAKSIDKTKLIIDKNGVNYITRKSTNNGMEFKVKIIQELINEGNCISMAMIGSKGSCFYQKQDFLSSQNMLLFRNKNLNKNISLFLINILEKKYKISNDYNAIKKDNVLKEEIYLPSILNETTNEFEPNWKYMEEYITDLLNELKVEELKNTIDNIKGIKEEIIDTINLKEYKIINLFEIIRGKRLRSVDRLKGKVRYFSSTSENNGVSDYISNPLFIEKNALIFNTFGNVFYCDNIFSGSDEITILKNKNLNKYIGIYLSTIMTKAFDKKFGYEKKAFYNEIIKEKIILPSKLNIESNEYEPDWEYMENYIKNLNI